MMRYTVTSTDKKPTNHKRLKPAFTEAHSRLNVGDNEVTIETTGASGDSWRTPITPETRITSLMIAELDHANKR